MIKNLFLIILLFTSSSFYAQRLGSGNGGGRQSQNQDRQQGQGEREVKEFKSSDVAGVFYYKTKKVIKKIRVKDSEKKASFVKALKSYNAKVKSIAVLNSKKFNDLDKLVNSIRTQARTNPELRKKLRKSISETVRPVRDSILKSERELNRSLEDILDKKQHEKWIKYQKSIKEKIMPKRPDRNNRGQQQGGNGQRRKF